MNGDHGLSDLRFEGYSNQQLAEQVDGLRNGQGSESLQNAARALLSLAAGLAETDKVLREQLQSIGVSWEGQAAEGGTQATQDAAVYATEAVEPVGDSAAGVSTQSGQFSHTRNSAPDSGTLRGPTEMSGFDRFAGALGHTTDHAQDVKDTNAARDAAVSGMNGYQKGSSDSLGRARTLPVPPGMDLVARPTQTGTHVNAVSGYGGGSGGAPAGSPGAPGTTAVPGGPGGSGGPQGPRPLSGAPGGPNTPNAPGPTTGIGPMSPLGGPAPAAQGVPGGPRAIPSLIAAEVAAIANAGAGGAALGASAEKDRLVRGRQGAPGSPGAPGNPEAKAPPKGATPLGTPPDDEARAARNAERFGAKQAKPGASIMQPAAGPARSQEDQEHVRKYGIDSGDVFGDERLTSPPLIGDNEDDEKKAD